MRARGDLRNEETATLPCVARAHARCPVASSVSGVSKSGIPSPARVLSLQYDVQVSIMSGVNVSF